MQFEREEAERKRLSSDYIPMTMADRREEAARKERKMAAVRARRGAAADFHAPLRMAFVILRGESQRAVLLFTSGQSDRHVNRITA